MRKVLAIALVSLLLAGSITYEGQSSSEASGAVIANLAIPAEANPGDLLLTVIANERGRVQDVSAPAGWSTVVSGDSNRAGLFVFARIYEGTELSPVTFTVRDRGHHAVMMSYAGNWDRVDFTSGAAAGDSPVAIAPSLPAEAGDVRLAIFAGEKDLTGTGPQDMTLRHAGASGRADLYVYEEGLLVNGESGAREYVLLTSAKWSAATIILHEAAPLAPPGITANPAEGLRTTEGGEGDQFTVTLDQVPAADVVVPIASNDAAEATVQPASLTFTTFNWDTPQVVTIAGVDDAAIDGDQPFAISLGPANSLDPRYNGLSGIPVGGINVDDDSRRVQFRTPSSSVTENAGIEYIPVTLDPAHDAVVEVKYGVIGGSASSTDHSLAVGRLTFQPGEQIQFIEFTIADDAELEQSETVILTLSEPSVDAALGSIGTHTLSIRDNEAPARVQSGAIALYAFHEGAGSTVSDISAGSMDLIIANPNAVTWVEDGLQIDSATTLSAGAASSALHAALTTRNEVTFEAWISPIQEAQTGPARIMGLETSAVSGHQDIHIGQEGQQANFRLRTSVSNPGVDLLSPAMPQTLDPIHVVVTHDGATKRVYIDGIEVASEPDSGDYSNWEPTATFTLANSISGDRPWLGTLHGAAVYNRALMASEVAQNHASGLGGLHPALLRVESGVFDDDGISGDGFWGAWNADPGASSVQGNNFLKITNLGDARGADAVIDFTDLQFTGVTDNRFGVPVANNVRYGYWEDDEPLMGRAPVDGAITWLPATAGARETIPITGSDNVVYVTYEIVQLPNILENQQYTAAYTVETVAA